MNYKIKEAEKLKKIARNLTAFTSTSAFTLFYSKDKISKVNKGDKRPKRVHLDSSKPL